jgi:hypothetical protein
MVRRIRALLGATTLGFAAWSLASCGGQSQVKKDDGSSGGTSSGGSAGSGGSSSGCEYNGVHYEAGEHFGECGECSCAMNGGISCLTIGCGTGATGGTSSSGGAAGSVAAGTGGTGIITPILHCDFGGARYEDGETWQNDCNTCWCKQGTVGCTMVACLPGSGGASGSGGTAGAGSGGTGTSGMAGEGGAGSCEFADIGSFCVVGTPDEVGIVRLKAGMQLGLELRPAGCYSSSCTELVSSSCNYIGMNGEYSITPFVCLATEGDACTDDCGGGGTPLCYPNLVLQDGTYAINLSGTSLWVKFQVPSAIVNEADLCSPTASDP